MYLIISGILIFTFGHMFKRLVPAGRDFVDQKLGEKLSKIFMRLILFIGFFLVTIGYHQEEYDIYFYIAPAWLSAVTHALMLVSVALLSVGHRIFGHASRLQKHIKHPMLTAAVVWCVAHLLINGTLMAFILFGSIGVWAAIQIYLLQKNNIRIESYQGSLTGDLILLGFVAFIYIIIVFIHLSLGSNMYPFL